MTTAAGNPYSPPRAEVRDAGASRLLAARPLQIVQAAALSAVSMFIGIVSAAIPYSSAPAQMLVETGIWACVIVAGILIIAALLRGRHWARVVYAAVTIVGVLGIPLEWSARPSGALALDIVSLVLAVIVVFLVFTKPGSLWFKYTREQRA